MRCSKPSMCWHLSTFAISVLGAARFPLKTSDWRSTRLGRDAFLHPSVPKGWWGRAYVAMAKREQDPGSDDGPVEPHGVYVDRDRADAPNPSA